MGENSEQIHTRLGELFSRFDSMTLEIANLGKQLEMTQESVDEVRMKQREAEKQDRAPPPIPPVPNGVHVGVSSSAAPRLVNLVPPVLNSPAVIQVAEHSDLANRPMTGNTRREHHSAPSSPREFFAKPPKHDFPKFDGAHPYMWFDLCHTYFEMYSTPCHQWLSVASLYFSGHAALWWQAYKRCHTVTNWEVLCAAIVEEFGQDEYDMHMSKLNQLRQSGSVLEYRRAFEEIMYQLISLDSSLNTKFFVSKFVLGLKDELRTAVRLQAPSSVTRAVSLARIQEEELELYGPRQRVIPSGKSPITSLASSSSTAMSVSGTKRIVDDYGRERQLRDYRRANGLCFRCGDKYSKEHKCQKPMQLLTIQLGEFGEVFTEDTVQALELLTEPDATPVQCCQLSLQAVSGGEASKTIRLRAQVGDQTMIILVDSGSSNCFINKEFARRAKCTMVVAPTVQVKVASGSMMTSDQQVLALSWMAQGYTFQTDMRVLELGGYDAVLGMDWLEAHSPMICDWVGKSLHIPHNGAVAHLIGIQSTAPTLSPIDVAQLRKAYAGNDIWAIAVVDLQSDGSVVPLTDKLPQDLTELLSEFNDVFATPGTLPPHRAYDHAIALETPHSPINCRPYRYSPMQKDEIERQVADMIKAGIVVPSMSPYASPVLLVKKKDGEWRFCVDYRRLNSSTIKNKFPLPIVDELLDELAGAQFFSKLDLRAGYHQIRMREADEEKTAFKTHSGHFQFRVMPFGLTNAPATFQCLMNSIFSEQIRKYVIVFLDDILIYSRTWTEHLDHLRLVLRTLRAHQLYAKMSKCSFAQDSISYLGHIISRQGVATDPEKTRAMENWPLPTSATELRGFLGLTGYYRKFVPGYGIIAKPLTSLLTKKGFYWTDQATQAFNQLKKAMVSTPVLALPDFSQPFAVETDACDTGVGAVLTQNNHPIAYLSKALGIKNSKLSVYEKEFLAVMMAVDKWRPYLQRGPFTIITDHKSLVNLQEQHLGTDLQRKAMAKMVGLQFHFKYKKGVDNAAADSLSRVAHLMATSTVSYCRPDWAQEVINSYSTDPNAQELLAQLAILSPDSKGHSLEEGLIRYKGRLWIGNNSALQTKLISAMHSSAVGGHSGVRATYQRVRKQYYWPGIKKQVEDWVRQCQLCQQAKHENTLPAGLLQPLPIPTRPWSHITMDFIDGLPKSDGFEVILVVVDRLTKYAHFIPLRHPYTAFQVATAFLDSVVKLHGVPASIVSDRDRVFTSHFWRQLFKAVGTKLSYSTAYHPQTDGQSERVNQCLEQYLRCAAHDSPAKWRKWLPMAEFWYNSSFHTSLGCSPFKALYGIEPNFGTLPNLGSADGDAITDVAAERQAHLDLLREQLLRAQVRMKNQADKKRSDRQFQVGDDVLLKLQPYVQSSLVQRPSAKMALKFYGPYKVLSRVGATAYRLALPESSKIHPVFHISQLKPFTPNYSPVFAELPSVIDLSIGSFLPEHILERRMVKKGNAAIPQIKVQWSTLSADHATWEDYHVLRKRFPEAVIWEGDHSPAGEGVASPLHTSVVTDTAVDPG